MNQACALMGGCYDAVIADDQTTAPLRVWTFCMMEFLGGNLFGPALLYQRGAVYGVLN